MTVYINTAGSLCFGLPPADADGNPTLSGVALRQAIIAGINVLCSHKLRDTDWVVTRQAETGVAPPEEITATRAALRQRANDLVAAILAAADDAAVLAVPIKFGGVAG